VAGSPTLHQTPRAIIKSLQPHPSEDGDHSIQHVANTTAPRSKEPPHEDLVELCKHWFEKYHPWHPILHQPSVEEYLWPRDSDQGEPHRLVLRAITALILPSWYPDATLGLAERLSWSRSLRRDILLRALGELSFHGLQAMLILSVLDYGLGNMSEFWNTIGICHRLTILRPALIQGQY
jgi:hypothetical protein